MEKYDDVVQMIRNAKNIVFFGGAGVSTHSDIPDFRSNSGLYKKPNRYIYSPETILSHSFFMTYPDKFYDYYLKEMVYPNAKPNIIHTELARLEKLGKLKAIVTQNIDGLHQMAGSSNVIELHGNVNRNYCLKCHSFYSLKEVMSNYGKCNCGGIIKPDVVLYEEPLDNEIINQAIKYISQADLLIVGGTSLKVYPASSLLNYFAGKNKIIINKEKTASDSYFDITLYADLKDVFEYIFKSI